jgi:Flp pilus assembly protein TadD
LLFDARDGVAQKPCMVMNDPLRSGESADQAYAEGVGLQRAGNLAAAMEEWRRALTIDPHHAPTLYNLAVGLSLSGDAVGAAALYEKLLKAQPAHREGLYNLANLFMRARKFEEATALYRRLIVAHPDFVPGLVNAAMGEAECRRPEEAEALLRRALLREPDNVNAHWNLSHLLLARHCWDEAWREYEWRLKRNECPKPPIAAPDWPGGAAPARRILLWNDQGLGDALQFLRFAAPLAAQGHKVYVFVQDALKNIAAAANGVAGAFGPSDPLPKVDAQAPLLSLPQRLPLVDPKNSWRGPYLKALEPMDLPRRAGHRAIGIAWAGNPLHPNDALRSAPLRDLVPLFEIPGIDWFSLQIGAPAVQISECGFGKRVHDLSPRLKDFTDTAAAMAALDLVITVDTAIAHLAGALGRPAFVMLPDAREWRWAGQETQSLWYPSLRLFRQKTAGDWRETIAAMKEGLGK